MLTKGTSMARIVAISLLPSKFYITQHADFVNQALSFYDPPNEKLLFRQANENCLLLQWLRDNWKPTFSGLELHRLDQLFKQHESYAMKKLAWNRFVDALMPPELSQEIALLWWLECASVPELSRKPKLALSFEVTSNLVVLIDVRSLQIHNRIAHKTVMKDDEEMSLRLKMVPNSTTLTAFNVFYGRYIL